MKRPEIKRSYNNMLSGHVSCDPSEEVIALHRVFTAAPSPQCERRIVFL
jgi:hypothetical protein